MKSPKNQLTTTSLQNLNKPIINITPPINSNHKNTQQKIDAQSQTQQTMYNNLNRYHSIFLSTIDQNQQHSNPQLIRIRNNILMLLLVLAAYGIYYLIGNFIDYLILGYISGLAYNQTRNKFTKIVMDSKTYQYKSQSIWLRFLKIFILLILAFILPRLRYMLSNPEQFKYLFHGTNYIKSFNKNNNMTVIICQIIIVILTVYILLSPYIKKIGSKIRPRNIKCIQCTFAIFVLLFTITIIALIPTVFFKQISEVSYIGQQKIQQLLQCQIITFGIHNNAQLPLCSQKVVENTFIKQTIAQFQNQNKTVQACKQYIMELQLDYIGYGIFHYDDIACTWYSIITKAYSYSAIQSQQISTASIVSTGTSIFKTVFGNLTSILLLISNIIFNFTIWLTTFLLTNKLSNRYLTIKHIFSTNKQQLIGNITKLIHATCLIVIWHFFMSLILLQLFGFTPINLIISILLSLMAFVPLFRPWFGVLFVALIRMIIMRQYIVPIVFVGLYWYISEWIYSFYYGKLQIHQIIINFSVLFGIYSFGITGIFYGPLIVILYTCVQKELLSNFGKSHQQNKYKNLNNDQQRQSYYDDKQLEMLRKKQSQDLHQKQKQGEQRSRSKEHNQNKDRPAVRVKYLKPNNKKNKHISQSSNLIKEQ